ncbi:hypothetical protein P3T37_004050 [Kitasatospora sp. MAA4]|uniref:hypothetical protein n=1 Tax=Kitasatospora sp. MAA4 TaxID=3035093 RepID=UPI002477112F|nr:hypothetical protein [Kitasatospora sp. MAA4]MDH6134646.1 hypothetical protein [Kitasatospora sp. MAA4]
MAIWSRPPNIVAVTLNSRSACSNEAALITMLGDAGETSAGPANSRATSAAMNVVLPSPVAAVRIASS